ncbi:hypothetical protein NP233_g2971 [Leucocoprinus birnbaumii]|uniref:Uncharacterized protein n=1 Tax=Leucocoprinus birnbaumii TaxID=56174 RepID=A0AAD5YUD7_9AGAR|nr:hypothetical protein NP233_g2971 [Leucocoprinus birnbaumii]
MRVNYVCWALSTLLLSLSTTQAATTEDVVASLEKVTTKAAVCQQQVNAINTATSVTTLLLNIDLNGVVSAIEDVQTTLQALSQAVSGPLSSSDYTEILNAIYQMQPVVTSSLQIIIDKKSIVDNLGFGRANAVVVLTLGQLKQVNDGIQEAFLALAPAELILEAQNVVEIANTAYNASLAVYL